MSKKTKNISPSENFLIGFAGANKEILEKPECQTEIPKYASLGLMVLCTGTLGFLSGGYAFFTIFGNVPIATFFGILWGMFVGGIDRFFVITARKTKDNDSDQIKKAIPRLILATLIGFIVSKPLELRIFKKEIELQLAKEKIENIKQVQESSSEYEEINKLEQEKAELRNEEKQLREKWSEVESIAHGEAEGISGTGKEGKGPVYKEKRQQADELKNQLQEKRKEINDLQVKIDDHKQKLAQTLTSISQKEDEASTLLGQLQALHNLAEEKPIVGQVNWSITLLFVIVEIMPLSLKLMTKYGPYDEALKAWEEEAIFKQKKSLESRKNEIQEEIKNHQIKRNEINKFNNQKFTEAITKASSSPELELVMDKAAKTIVDNTEKQIMKTVNNVPNNNQEIVEQVNKSQQEYIKVSVDEQVKQKATKSKVEDIFKKDLHSLNNHNNNGFVYPKTTKKYPSPNYSSNGKKSS